jgi:hypothetical protein
MAKRKLGMTLSDLKALADAKKRRELRRDKKAANVAKSTAGSKFR